MRSVFPSGFRIFSDGNIQDKAPFVSTVLKGNLFYPMMLFPAVDGSLGYTEDRHGHVCDPAGDGWSASFIFKLMV